MQIVEHPKPEVSHGERFLGHGSSDAALLNPIEGLDVRIHRNHNLTLYVLPLENFGDFLSGGGFQTDEAVDGHLALFDDLHRAIERKVGSPRTSIVCRILISLSAIASS